MKSASAAKPGDLVGQWVYVEGLGVGQVKRFEKKNSMDFSEDLKHEIDFVQHGVRLELLLRKKRMAWNRGLKFYLCDEEQSSAKVSMDTSMVSKAKVKLFYLAHSGAKSAPNEDELSHRGLLGIKHAGLFSSMKTSWKQRNCELYCNPTTHIWEVRCNCRQNGRDEEGSRWIIPLLEVEISSNSNAISI